MAHARLGAMNSAENLLEGAREKKRAALWSVVSAVALVSLKVFLSVRTGSLGGLSEALHSSLDLIAAIITFLSVHFADQPADENHPYGHGKVENFSAFVETGLLLLTALYIIWEAFQRLFFREAHLTPTLTAIFILVCAMAIDLLRARALRRVARKFMSEALEADALHFSTDVWSTFVVILGIAAVWAGERRGAPWLRAHPDNHSRDALLDAARAGLRQSIFSAVKELDGVLDAERVRVRRAGNRYFVDVTIQVPRTASFEQVHALSDAVEHRIAEIVPADVMVHMEPRAPAGEHLFEAIRAIAHRRGLAIHDLSAHQADGKLFVELHLEVDEQQSLREAHRRATELEEEIRKLPSGDAQVNIHIEPLGRHIATAAGAGGEMKELARAVEKFLNALPKEFHELANCHDVRALEVEHHILVSCHCAMDGSLPITQVHDVTAALEDRVKEKFPQIFRVTIHPEPVEER